MLTDYDGLVADEPDAFGLSPVPPAEAAGMVKRINAHLPAFPLDPASCIVRAAPLPFYPLYRLASLTDLATLPPYEVAALVRPRDAILLDGTIEPVLEANRRDGLRLDRETVAAYVRFLFAVLLTDGEPLVLTADPILRTAAPAAAWSLDVAFRSGGELAAARLDLDRAGRPSFAEPRVTGAA